VSVGAWYTVVRVERVFERGGGHVSVTELPDRRDDQATASGYDRIPPQDVAAEQSVLGGMLLSKDAIADVVEVLRGHDMYRPAHETVYEAILDLYGRGEPADPLTVADELKKRGELGRVGGAPYLHTLVSSVPTAANAGYYAEIVRERAVLRRLVEAGMRIVQMGYGGDGDADDIVDRAQAEVYSVTDRRTSDDYLPLGDIMEGTLDEIEAIGSRGGQMVGVPTGFADLDALTNGLHPGQLVVVAARPAIGKSTLGLDISRTAAIRHQLTTVMFSLEMSRNEITMRLLSAEGRVPLHHMRSGQMTDDDWNRIARRTGEVSSAPLFIDDSPNMTMMEIRAKCRRLKQRHDLRLVVIDYLQLMTSGKKVESRQQEVAEFSRALKLLAKELDLPVVAISQLNRSAEQRQDKKPMLADLRESGCVTAATRVLRADTGEAVPIGELMATGECDIPVWAVDESLRCVPRTLTHAFPSGRRQVLRVRLASGRAVEATSNHRFLTYGGWCPLADLAVGGRVAVTRHVPAPMSPTAWPVEEVIARARLVRDGSAVPGELFSLPNEQIAVFLRYLWAGSGGSMTVDRAVRGGNPSFTSTRQDLVRDVSSLLLRFGISARVRAIAADPSSPRLFTVDIVGRDEQVRFLRTIACRGARDEHCAELLAELTSSTPGPTIDTIPVEVWARVRAVMAEPETPPHRVMVPATSAERRGSAPSRGSSGRQRLGRVAALLDDADVEIHATNDVLWDSITSIEPIGEHDVYDATVMGVHNFIGNGVALHNSIEQDADMVILLHREDAYEKESPRAGEADFIVAKHRNGPTATITVAFQGHYSRFVDMAQ
jgi:replicative DNA helicase